VKLVVFRDAPCFIRSLTISRCPLVAAITNGEAGWVNPLGIIELRFKSSIIPPFIFSPCSKSHSATFVIMFELCCGCGVVWCDVYLHPVFSGSKNKRQSRRWNLLVQSKGEVRMIEDQPEDVFIPISSCSTQWGAKRRTGCLQMKFNVEFLHHF